MKSKFKYVSVSMCLTVATVCMSACSGVRKNAENVASEFLSSYIRMDTVSAAGLCSEEIASMMKRGAERFFSMEEEARSIFMEELKKVNAEIISSEDRGDTVEVRYAILRNGKDTLESDGKLSVLRNAGGWKVVSIN